MFYNKLLLIELYIMYHTLINSLSLVQRGRGGHHCITPLTGLWPETCLDINTDLFMYTEPNSIYMH